MSNSKVGTIEAIMLILTIIITHTILSLPKRIITLTKSASILNLIYVGIIAVLLAYLIYKLIKSFPGLDLIDISEFLGGKIFKNIVGTIFMLHFIITSSLLLRNFCEVLKIVYYPMTNIIFILAFFIIAVCIANYFDFSSTLKANLIIVPIVLASIIFLLFSNIKNFVPQRIFPILGDGLYNTFVLGILNLSSFGGLTYLYFLPPLLNEPEKMKKISLISIGVSAIYLILCVSIILFMFSSFIDINEISLLYSATRYVEFGKFLDRLESVFLLIWMIVFACYLSIVLKFVMTIFRKITNIQNKKPLIPIFGLLILAISLIPKNLGVSEFFENQIYPYMVLFIVIILGIGILVFANFKLKKSQKQKS